MRWRPRVRLVATALCLSFLLLPTGWGWAGTLELNLDYNKSFTDWDTPNGEKLGGGVGGGIGYWQSVSPDLSWGLEAAYDDLGTIDFDYSDPFSGGTPSSAHYSAKILRFTPGFRANVGGSEGPNFVTQVGAGLYHLEVSWRINNGPFIFDGEENDAKFGLHLGAGVALPLGAGKRLSAMGLYHLVNGDETFADDYNHLQGRVGLAVVL